MRQAGTLATREQAQRFADFLLSQGIVAKVDSAGDAWSIWIRDEDQLPRALSELQQFAGDPHADRYRQGAEAAVLLRKQQEHDEHQRQKNLINVRDRWEQRPAGRRPLTMILIAACVAVAIATDGGTDKKSALLNLLWFSSPPPQTVLEQLTSDWTPTKAIEHGQVWRLVTPAFIHFGPMHLIFDLYALYLFGSLIEARRGTIHFGLLVLASAIVSNYCQYYIPFHFAWAGQPSIYFGGMSGVDYGLFGYLWIKSRFVPSAGFYLPPNLVATALIWMVVCFTGALGPIANWAHGMGLASGVVIAYAPVAWRKFM